ncbi:MAG: TrkA C-terminal domain-containing protein [Eubacterium sp.]|jgi:K+/H+ antiporter YhaU regulatory subunit KhtT
MSNSKKKYVYESRYQQISVEIAKRIAEGWYAVGERLNARTTLASNYGVSPETARKAVHILCDLGIMEVRQGSGTYVLSRQKAQQFLERYQNTVSVEQVRAEINACVKNQQKEIEHLSKLLNKLIGQTTRDRAGYTLEPYELHIDEHCYYLGKTIGEVNIWQETGATIVEVMRDDTFIVSPGPYEKIQAGDTLLFVGNEESRQRMLNLFCAPPEDEKN